MNLTEQHILLKAKELFLGYGIRSITMDDIARMMGISKKTIYKHFSDKSFIVQQVISDLAHAHAEKMRASTARAENAVAEVALHLQNMYEVVAGLKPSVFFELQKYFPETWQTLICYKNNFLANAIISNLERGKKEGLYRAGLDSKLVSYIQLKQMNMIVLQATAPINGISVHQLMHQLAELYLYSITTSEGQQLIPQELNKNNH